MYRHAVLLLVAGLSAPGSWAQSNGVFPVRQAPGTVRNAGVLHLASGTWTRGAGQASLGPTVIYNSTCTGFPPAYTDRPPDQGIADEGRIPSPTGPSDDYFNRPGCAANYTVDGFQIAYGVNRTSLDCTISFFESYSTCANPASYTPTASYYLPSLPAASSPGATAVWVVTIDLVGMPGPPFTIAADRDGAFDPASGVGNVAGGLDRFGWYIRFGGAGPEGAGPLLSGQCTPWLTSQPSWEPGCRGFDGTIWDPIVNLAEPGIGMSTTDLFWLDGVGCYSYTFGAFYLRLYSSVDCAPRPGTSFCHGDGSGTPCPCFNSPVGFRQGCISTSTSGGFSTSSWLRTEGTPSLAADGLLLRASGLTQNTSTLFFQGTTRMNGGLGTTFGDGLRCAGGSVVRLATKVTTNAGTSFFPDAGDPSVSVKGQITGPGLRTYQAWFRVAANFCTPATFNLTNGWEVPWTL